MTVSLDQILCRGGMDQITPTLSLANSFCRNALNFEASVTGGYARIAGYERFNGRQSPADAATNKLYQYITFGAFTNAPSVGDRIEGDGGISGGTIAEISGLVVAIAKIGGTWAAGQAVTAGATPIGTVTSIADGPATPEEDALIKNAVADLYRADIGWLPGSGPVRGVVEYNDTVYGFRDNVRFTVTAFDNTPNVGDVLQSSSGADGVVVSVDTLTITLSSVNGTFGAGDTLTVGVTPIGTIATLEASDACYVYQSSGGGWLLVPMLLTVSFTGGLGEPAEGDTLTQDGVTARIRRVVRTAGSWLAGDAEGQFIIDSLAGGNFEAGVTTAGVTCTLAGAETLVSLPAGGRYEFEERNFAGQSVTNRVYGVNGVGKAFEFDGEILVPITTGAAVDTPTHLACHKGYLFLSLGSSIMHSSPGLPYDWSALNGAGEIASGNIVTAIISMPGGTNAATLGVFNRSNTLILYGSSPADWNLVAYNTGTGAMEFSVQNMSQTYAFDDRGAQSIQTALQYGNFTQSTLTNTVLPFINSRINLLTSATLCRRKSQYRLFFSDGFGLFITIVNGKLLGCMPVYFPNPVTCTYEGKKSTGEDIIYFGSTNGYVYQMEKGTSFDGEAIDFNLTMNYSNAKSPRTLKRYRKCVPELYADEASFAKFNISFMLGYDSNEYSQPAVNNYSRYAGASRWDVFIWDNFFWDSKPNDFLEVYMDGTAENVAILIDGSYDYIPAFTINSFLVHLTPRRMMR